MTFSIVACDLARGDWGVAVASRFPAVGSVVPWARAGVGAVATQSYANTDYGLGGLDLLASGCTAEEALHDLVAADEGRAQRQAGIVDAAGRAATFSGGECMPWAGGVAEDGFACQGNILTGPQVVEAMAEAFRSASGELVDRLVAGLAAGDAAGGDRRGRQSAALLVVRAAGGYGGRNDRYIDLRVDDHPDATNELLRVFRVFDEQYLIRSDEVLPATPELVEEVQAALTTLGLLHEGEASRSLDGSTRAAVEEFAGRYNLEGKVDWSSGGVYRSLVAELREAAAVHAGE